MYPVGRRMLWVSIRNTFCEIIRYKTNYLYSIGDYRTTTKYSNLSINSIKSDTKKDR